MNKGQLHKLALDRLEFLLTKEENNVNKRMFAKKLTLNESQEIEYLTMYIELFEDIYYSTGSLVELNDIIKSKKDADLLFKNTVNPKGPNEELKKAAKKYKKTKIKKV